MSPSAQSVREISVKWDEVLLVCRKCGKKQGGGFGPKGAMRLEKVLAKAFRGKGRPKTKVIAVPCLDICPKNGVVVAKPSRQGSAYIVSPGISEAELLDALDLKVPKQGSDHGDWPSAGSEVTG